MKLNVLFNLLRFWKVKIKVCIVGVLWCILNFFGVSVILDWKLIGEDWGERKSVLYKVEWWVIVLLVVNNGKLIFMVEKMRKRMK